MFQTGRKNLKIFVYFSSHFLLEKISDMVYNIINNFLDPEIRQFGDKYHYLIKPKNARERKDYDRAKIFPKQLCGDFQIDVCVRRRLL